MKIYSPQFKRPRTYKLTRSGHVKFETGRKVYDCDVARHAISHMRFIDILNPFKVARAALTSFTMLSCNESNIFKNLKFKYKFK